MMKVFIVLLLTSIVTNGAVQTYTPVKWNYGVKEIGTQTYEVILTASIDEGWHIYSQITPPGGPLPTRITFKEDSAIILDGKVKEMGELERKYEDVFGIDVKYYAGRVDFVQVVKVKGTQDLVLTGSVLYMACDDQQCLPPEKIEFKVPLN